MFKKIVCLFSVFMIITSIAVLAADTYGGYSVPVDIEINGSFIKCDQKPLLIDATTYSPLRAFSDAIGGTISWNGEEMAATMEKDGHSFVVYPEKDVCLIDGTKKEYASVLYRDFT